MPSITIWSRLEPRSRSQDLKAGLEARVHDPLWLLARQWQVGEFAGKDAGSPVTVDIQATTAAFDRYAPGTQVSRAYDNRLPLETLVEREAIRPGRAADDLRQAAEAGLYFLRLLDRAGLSRLWPAYVAQYPLPAATVPDDDTRRFLAVMGGRVVDGVKLRLDLAQAGNALPALPAIAAADHDAVLKATRDFLTWFGSLFSELAGAAAWTPERMEYSFALGAGGDTGSFVAREYDGGAVDWHTFDRSATALTGGTAKPAKLSRRVMAAPVSFRGMPARRFWELEDASVDIGALTAGAEDLGRLLLREFALIYGNEWFQVPLAVPVGSEVSIDSFSVSDTFGVVTKIPHYMDADGAGGRWRMFALSNDPSVSGAAPSRLLVVVPGAMATLDGPAVEDVLLLRDEAANMAWGIERTALGSAGTPVDRALVWKTKAPPATPPTANALPRYRLGSSVPDYWIPFLPVGADAGHLRIKRAALPSSTSTPRGRFLSVAGLSMFQEELPREGVHLERRFRFARGPDGSTYLWIGRRRTTGRGEGRSGLRFDYLET